MLTIGTVKWKGRCSRHPMFDPESDGPSAIRGGCTRCQDLLTILENHQRTLQLMRSFAPVQERKKPAHPDEGRQASLFDFADAAST